MSSSIILDPPEVHVVLSEACWKIYHFFLLQFLAFKPF
uniref:Uncharacterized protein n=1 Tax=Triticum urartu TaxID=4572 RepID=A0A8R7ULC0_TRIUA